MDKKSGNRKDSTSLLLDYSYTQLHGLQVSIDKNDERELKDALKDFIEKKKTLEETKKIYNDKIGTDLPVTVADDILNSSDTPLEQYKGEDTSIEDSNGTRKKTRTWTAQEDQRLVGGIYRFGFDSWIRVANYVGSSRSRAQCAQRWTRGLNPAISKSSWTKEEDRKLLLYVKNYGQGNWARIAEMFGNRTDVQCRYHYTQLVGPKSQFMGLNRAQVLSHSYIYPSGTFQPLNTSLNQFSSQLQLPRNLLAGNTSAVQSPLRSSYICLPLPSKNRSPTPQIHQPQPEVKNEIKKETAYVHHRQNLDDFLNCFQPQSQ